MSATPKQQAIVIIHCIIYPASLCILTVTRHPLDIPVSVITILEPPGLHGYLPYPLDTHCHHLCLCRLLHVTSSLHKHHVLNASFSSFSPQNQGSAFFYSETLATVFLLQVSTLRLLHLRSISCCIFRHVRPPMIIEKQLKGPGVT